MSGEVLDSHRGSQAAPPPQATYILRGHASTIHALCFWRNNSRLVSGDADGWILVWDVALKRPVAVWKAHESTILGIGSWGLGRLITHGRDRRLCVWDMGASDDATLSQQLPVEDSTTHRKQPWLLHSLSVSVLTFCSFSSCIAHPKAGTQPEAPQLPHQSKLGASTDELLVAVSGEDDSSIEIHHLPSEQKVALIPAPVPADGPKTGMVMAINIYYADSNKLHVAAGYESGRTYLFQQVHVDGIGQWETIYTARPHDQPILSLDVAPSRDYYLTSSADAVIARHSTEAVKQVQTKHSGQQGLRIRSDGKIFATAGWDARARVYSCKTMKELAVLKWHKEGCYAVAFAEVDPASDGQPQESQSSQVIMRPQTTAQVRDQKARSTHWLAVGSKDGKISLWDIY